MESKKIEADLLRNQKLLDAAERNLKLSEEINAKIDADFKEEYRPFHLFASEFGKGVIFGFTYSCEAISFALKMYGVIKAISPGSGAETSEATLQASDAGKQGDGGTAEAMLKTSEAFKKIVEENLGSDKQIVPALKA